MKESERKAKEKLAKTHYRDETGRSMGKVPTNKKGGGNDDSNYDGRTDTHGLARRIFRAPPKRGW